MDCDRACLTILAKGFSLLASNSLHPLVLRYGLDDDDIVEDLHIVTQYWCETIRNPLVVIHASLKALSSGFYVMNGGATNGFYNSLNDMAFRLDIGVIKPLESLKFDADITSPSDFLGGPSTDIPELDELWEPIWGTRASRIHAISETFISLVNKAQEELDKIDSERFRCSGCSVS